MTNNKLKLLEQRLGEVRWQGKHRIPGNDRATARAVLAELGVNGAERVPAQPQVRWIEDTDEGREQLDTLPEGTVLRDAEERVLERFKVGWWMTGVDFHAEDPVPIDLPARVLYTPQDES